MQLLHGGVGFRDESGLESQGAQQRAEGLTLDGSALEDQGSQAPQGDPPVGGRRTRRVGGQRDGEVAAGALSPLALHANPAAHLLDQARGDGETEPLVGDADPTVGHRKLDEIPASLVSLGVHSEDHLSPLTELDGVTEELLQDPTQPFGIAADGVGQSGVDVADEGQALLFGVGRQGACRLSHEGRQREARLER